MKQTLLLALALTLFTACKKSDENVLVAEQINYHFIDSTSVFSSGYPSSSGAIIFQVNRSQHTITRIEPISLQPVGSNPYAIFRTDTFYSKAVPVNPNALEGYPHHTFGNYAWVNFSGDTVRIMSLYEQGQYYQNAFILTGVRVR